MANLVNDLKSLAGFPHRVVGGRGFMPVGNRYQEAPKPISRFDAVDHVLNREQQEAIDGRSNVTVADVNELKNAIRVTDGTVSVEAGRQGGYRFSYGGIETKFLNVEPEAVRMMSESGMFKFDKADIARETLRAPSRAQREPGINTGGGWPAERADYNYTPKPAAGESISYTNGAGEKRVVSSGIAPQPTDEQRLNTLANQMNSVNMQTSGAGIYDASHEAVKTAQRLVGKDDKFSLYVPATMTLEDGKEITIPKGNYTTGSLLNAVMNATGVDENRKPGLQAAATNQNIMIAGAPEKIVTFSDVLVDASRSQAPVTQSGMQMMMAKAGEANINLDVRRLDDGVYRITQEGERGLGTTVNFDAAASAQLDQAIAAKGNPTAAITTNAVTGEKRLADAGIVTSEPAPTKAAVMTAEEMNDRPAIYAREDALETAKKAAPASAAPAATAQPAPAVAAPAAPAIEFTPMYDRTLVNSIGTQIGEASKVRTANDDARAIEAFLKNNPVIGADGKPIADTRPGFKDDGILSEVEATAALNRAEYMRMTTRQDGKAVLNELNVALSGQPAASTAVAAADTKKDEPVAEKPVVAAAAPVPKAPIAFVDFDSISAEVKGATADLQTKVAVDTTQPTLTAGQEVAPSTSQNLAQLSGKGAVGIA